MTGTEPSSAGKPHWRVLRSVAAPCFEWIGFARATGALGVDCERPGCVNALPGEGQSLHYAPDRWLIPNAEPSTVADLERAEDAGEGVLTEVCGKWLRIRIAGAASAEPLDWPLAAGFAREHLLKDRDCGALWLFDCPVIASMAGPDLDIWLEASYEASFLSMLASLGIPVS